MLLVQVVRILWTKATRGAPRANERAVLPRSFTVSSPRAEFAREHVDMREWEGFVPQRVEDHTGLTQRGSVGVLRIAPGEEGSFVLGLMGTPDGGQPKRAPRPKLVQLAPGEYAQLSINARHATYSGQYYSETIFNVASGSSIDSNRFAAMPDHVIDLKEHLF